MPGSTPVTIPLLLPTVAVDPDVLQVPPPGQLSVVLNPTHTVPLPVIAEAPGVTVTTIVVVQPPAVYEIVAVPVAIPLTTPVEPTVAIPVAPELHVPPVVVLNSGVVWPTHTDVVPLIAGGAGFTLTG